MTDRFLLPNPFVPTHTWLDLMSHGASLNPAAAAWNAVNRAIITPIIFPADCSIYNMTMLCGTAVGNYDMGFYLPNMQALARKDATTMTVGTLTLTFGADIRVTAGRIYYAAAVGSSTSGTVFGFTTGDTAFRFYVQASITEMESAIPLPLTLIPEPPSGTLCPVFAFGVR